VKKLFSPIQMFLGIGYETRILEACNWDEKEAKNLIDLFSYEINAALKKNNKNPVNTLVIKEIKKELLVSLEIEKVDVLISILEDACKNAELLIESEDTGEN
tara:strand:+ start:472 stop:777 length:306 start_codon:yes stop_codon:yes gene_type:complete